jgi:catechol 2,3-dioxygenase-like lactoylglutathione lyase family enzyme
MHARTPKSVVGSFSIAGTHAHRHRDLTIRRQQHEPDVGAGRYDLNKPRIRPNLDVGAQLATEHVDAEPLDSIMVDYESLKAKVDPRGLTDRGNSRICQAVSTCGERRVFMKTSVITATLPAQDLSRAKAFYVDKVGLQAVESHFLVASDGRVGFTVGDDVSQLFVYPATARSSGEFTQAVLQVTDVHAVVEELRGRGVKFEEYDTAETWTENAIARTPDGREGAWFQDSEGNLVGIVTALAG